MSGTRLEQVTAANIDAVLAVEVASEQAHLVGPVAKSLAEAYVHGPMAWPRAVLADDDIVDDSDPGQVVGFVMAFIDNEWNDDPDDVRSGLWRLNIDAGHQGLGYGRFAVEAVCAELRRRGTAYCYVTYHLGPHSPGRPTGAVTPRTVSRGRVGRRWPA